MSAAKSKDQDPSMEEILASIRKIISDDDVPAAEAAPAPAAAAEDAPSSQDDIDALLAAFDTQNDSAAEATEPATDSLDEMLEEANAANDVLELTEEVADAADIMGDDDIEFREVEEEVAEDESDWDMALAESSTPDPFEFAPVAAAAATASTASQDDLLSSRTGQAVQNAFSTLAHTILSQNARTLEDLVADMLKPMLKTWLDDNLPPMVERLIKAEIERVARGGR